MPTETKGFSFKEKKNIDKYKRILEVLSLDLNELGDTPFDLYGDFNAHVGNSSNGIPGNHSNIGNNGRMLLEWIDVQSITIVNSHPNLTKGLWT